jgi:hypothetical protein
MKKKKIYLGTGIVIIVCIIILYVVYIKPYPITDKEPAIKRSIEQLAELGPVSIKKIEEIGQSKVVLFSFENEIGESIFDKGMNKKLRIRSAGHGSSEIRYRIIKSGDFKYLTLLGVNQNLGSAKISVGGEIYNLSIPKDRYFISKVKISNSHESLIEWLILYDTTKKEVLRINLPQ